jgi:hypothetical protein
MDIYTNMRLVPVEEAVNEAVNIAKQPTKSLLRLHGQMKNERLSGHAALLFRLITKELIKRKVKLELNFPGKIGKFAEILKVNEVAPEGWEGTVKAMKNEKGIDNPWAMAWWMKKKGYKSHKEVKEGAIFAVKGKSGPGGHKKANTPPFNYDPEK